MLYYQDRLKSLTSAGERQGNESNGDEQYKTKRDEDTHLESDDEVNENMRHDHELHVASYAP